MSKGRDKLRILVISQNHGARSDLTGFLLTDGGEYHHAAPSRAVAALLDTRPDVVVIDVPVPDIESLNLIHRLRETDQAPIVICSLSDNETHVVEALRAGADEYLALPRTPAEINARLRAVARRASPRLSEPAHNGRIVAGALVLDLNSTEAFLNNEPLDLTPTEFRLLATLAREHGHPVSHQRLLLSGWGPEFVDCRHYLRLYIRYLREKLEDDPKAPSIILNDWGIGYRLEPPRAEFSTSAVAEF